MARALVTVRQVSFFWVRNTIQQYVRGLCPPTPLGLWLQPRERRRPDLDVYKMFK